jgi:hypothetical protein
MASAESGLMSIAWRSTRSRTSGFLSTASNSRDSRSTISRGSFAGPKRAIHGTAGKGATPDSVIVGSSGSALLRSLPSVAIPRARPSRRCWASVPLASMSWMRPVTRSLSAVVSLLYATTCRSNFSARAKAVGAIVAAAPELPAFSLPGWARP